MAKKNETCLNCNTPSSPIAESGLYYWCFLVLDPKGKHGFSEIRLGSTIGDIDEMLSQFEQEMPLLKVVGYTSIKRKHLKSKRQIFVVINNQLRLNPQMLPLE